VPLNELESLTDRGSRTGLCWALVNAHGFQPTVWPGITLAPVNGSTVPDIHPTFFESHSTAASPPDPGSPKSDPWELFPELHVCLWLEGLKLLTIKLHPLLYR
jgi:hypothetical protein